jgi:hypothetical protein
MEDDDEYILNLVKTDGLLLKDASERLRDD